MKAEFLTALLARACWEVVAWQLDLVTAEECCQLLVQQGKVQGMQVLEVVVSLIVERRFVTIQEVVVKRDTHRHDAIDGELHAKTFACRSLTAGRGPCDEHELDALPLGNLVGNLGNLFLLKSLADLDEHRGVSLTDDIVEVAYCAQPEDVLPLVVFLEDAEHLVLVSHLTQLVGMFTGWQTKQQTVIILLHSEEIYLGGIG